MTGGRPDRVPPEDRTASLYRLLGVAGGVAGTGFETAQTEANETIDNDRERLVDSALFAR